MCDDLIIQGEVYCSNNGAFHINKALFKNEPCYSVQNTYDGQTRTVIFDDNKIIKQALVSRMIRTGALCEKKDSGSGFLFNLRKGKHDCKISLRLFLWGKYHGISPKKVRGLKIELSDKESFADNIMDMRSTNLYDAGGTNTEGISIFQNCVTNEPFIMAHYENRIEFLEYSPEMYTMLTTRKMCSQCRKTERGRDSGRLYTSICFAKGKKGRVIKNLSRFVLLYDENFWRFQNFKAGNITRFLHNVPALDPNGDKIDCGHLNALSWNNCRENMMFMPKKLNDKMSHYARLIAGEYSMLPIAWKENGETKILIEWNAGDSLSYYVCDSVADYVNFQETVLGKNRFLRNLTAQFVDREGKVRKFNTPMQAARPYNEPQAEMSERELKTQLWMWCAGRDRVIDLYKRLPGVFVHWKNTDNLAAGDYQVIYQILRVLGFSA